jgi:hypothetical protein
MMMIRFLLFWIVGLLVLHRKLMAFCWEIGKFIGEGDKDLFYFKSAVMVY